MIKGFRGSDGDIEPVPFECEVFGYPNKTTDGETMFINTHFLSEGDAWDSILSGWEAGVHIYTRLVEQAKADLAKYEAQLKEEKEKRAIARGKNIEWLNHK
jgi:hypothetical protein